MDLKELFSLKGRNAIVTGGSRGLGKGMARGLAAAGANVAIVARNLERAQATAAEIAEEFGVRTLAFSADVSKAGECVRVVDEITKEWPEINILLNNAGICINIEAEDVSIEDWDKVINTNLNSVFYMAQPVGKLMIKQGKGGSIINLTSMSGTVVNNPQPQASYNTAKAGGDMLTKCLAAEWAKYNIRVNAIAPGYFNTDLCAEALAEGNEMGKFWLDCTPMHRAGIPDELGPLAVYLASDASSFVTGSVYLIDGGYTIW
jgi:NAD(P)-dependent dehydrogenase (short-subunit alcohol dehydrogenase family)